MDKNYNFVIKPLKIWPPGKRGKHNIFSRNFNNYNQNSQFKKFEKNLSSPSVGDEHP